MVRCADFYEKWKKDPNWCEKSPDTVDLIDHYLELVDELKEYGIDPIAIYKKFPEGIARVVMKITDDTTHAKVIKNIAGKIKRGDKVSQSDVNTWLGLAEKPRKIPSSSVVTPNTDDHDPTIVGKTTGGTASTKKPLTRPEPGDKNYGQYCAQPGSLPPESDAPIPAPLSEKLKEPAAKPATPYTADAIRQSAKDRINRMDQYAVAFINELSPAKQMAIEEYQRMHLEYQTMADLVVVAIDQMITSKK